MGMNKMIGIVIADDEQIIRQGLAGMPWSDIDVELRGIASNGVDALELLKKTDSKIILTDIRMPDLDGIDLIHIIKDELPDIKSILLTGHQEFEYAYSAIKYGAFEFILKPTDPDEILEIIQRAKKEIESENKSTFVYNFKNTNRKDSIAANLSVDGNLPSESINEIINNVKVRNYHNVKVLTRELLVCLSNHPDANGVLLKNACIEIITLASHLLVEKGTEQFEMQDRLVFYSNINTCKDIEELILYTNILLEKIIDSLNFMDDLIVNKTVDECLSYIEQYYMDDITLVSLARNIHRNPIYLSRLIKKVQGKNFSDILTFVRMNKACELLRNQDLKAYEVSNKVGFKDSRYFSQVFRKHYGVTPTEYRKEILQKYLKKDGVIT